jgi:endoglucanase
MEFFAKNGNIVLNEQKVNIKGANWFGFETEVFCLHGLWSVSMTSLLDFLQMNKFNALRIPLSVEAIFGLDTLKCKAINTSANPNMVDWTAGKLLDHLVVECSKRGILVMPDIHRMVGTGFITELWYDDQNNEAKIIEAWKIIVKRYLNYPNVFAIDIKNEPHGKATWNSGNPATDWNAAATRIGNAILDVNPKLLIFVAGVESYKGEGSWWGGTLAGVKDSPVKLKVNNKVVYTPHVYGPSVFDQTYFHDPSYPSNLLRYWDNDWAFIKKNNLGTVVIGEWGGKMLASNKDDVWQNAMGDFLLKNNFDFFYWSLNPNSGDTGGLVEDDWKTPVQKKLTLLAKVSPNPTKFTFSNSPVTPSPQPPTTPDKPPAPKPPTPKPPTPKPPAPKPPAPKPPAPKPPAPTPKPPANNKLTMTISTTSWDDGSVKLNKYDVIVKNTSGTTVPKATFKIVCNKIRQLWNLEGASTQQTFTFPNWLPNGLTANAEFSFGFISEGVATISIS